MAPDPGNAATPRTLPSVDVCVCTYHRTSLFDALTSLARQDYPQDRVRVIVADNADLSEIRQSVEDTARRLGLRVDYIHAPARNISIARNACLDAASAPYIAFLDDDEEADANWISALVGRLADTGADVVLGPVDAVYADEAPAWMKHARLHDTRPTILAGGNITTGYTCNVMMRAGVVGDLRFLPELGRTGGEDSVFFAELHRRGARLTYANAARVRERVPRERESLTWLTSRAFRTGQTHGRMLLSRPGGTEWPVRATGLGLAWVKCAVCIVQAAVFIWSPAGWRRGLMRACLHAGVVSRLAGKAEIELY